MSANASTDERGHPPDGTGRVDCDDAGVPRETAWLSKGFECLAARLTPGGKPPGAAPHVYDVVVVGSGYGAAVAAAELAGRLDENGNAVSVCVLERGREYLPGMFPSRMADLPGHVRASAPGLARPRGVRDGLFDIRVGPDVCAVVANGLGGGSLINAGVMEWPVDSVWADRAWPGALRGDHESGRLSACRDDLRRRLGAQRADGTLNTVADAPHPPRKHEFLRELSETGPKQAGRAAFKSTPITIALLAGARSSADIPLKACIGCGDCATGCNHEAKDSLDVNLLALARRRKAEIYTGATVLRLEKSDAGPWHLHVNHTDEALRRRQPSPIVLRARRVVLAAGTFGSTEILLRSRSGRLRFSEKLGHRFSANGDMIAAAYDTDRVANAAGDETRDFRSEPPSSRIGPTITGMIDARGGMPGTDDVVLQDLAVPGPLRRIFEEASATAATLHDLDRSDDSRHSPRDGTDPAAVDPAKIVRSLAVAMIGRDTADGRLELVGGRSPRDGDGAIRVRWPTLRHHPPFAAHHRWLRGRLERSGVRGTLLSNPMWQVLPQGLQYLLGHETGPMLTVHPLGGCPMGEDVASGVVDHLGRVFDPGAAGKPAASAGGTPRGPWHEGLVVLDGSIVPLSLGINPALTIAALALRAVTALCADDWKLSAPPQRSEKALAPRPTFRTPQVLQEPRATQIEVVERLTGKVRLRSPDGRHEDLFAELTLRFDPVEVRQLIGFDGSRRLQVSKAAGKSRAPGRLRLFREDPRLPLDEPEDASAELVADVSGSLRVFHREESSARERRLRALPAWIANRGLRDTVLWAIDRFSGRSAAPAASAGRRAQAQAGVGGKGRPAPVGEPGGVAGDALARARSAYRLGSRAGTVRLFEYALRIDKVTSVKEGWSWERAHEGSHPFEDQPIRGVKRLTYSRRSNPWRQLMEMTLEQFPRMQALPEGRPTLSLDTAYLARLGMPLLRIVSQQDQPSALADMASLAAYLLRMLLLGHIWSFRAPDAPQPRRINNLPDKVPGLPEPFIETLQVDTIGRNRPVMIRLARYRGASGAQPVLLVHGYSASGTTFAHPSVRPNLAEHLWAHGKRDVWIVDLRTSAGMRTATHPWAFEDVARKDLPAAVNRILAVTGAEKIEVFAHCMGAAMMGMALLDKDSDLHRRIAKLAMSQVAPAVVFTAANVFRAYAMGYLRHVLPLERYRFRRRARPGLGEQLLDRLLATLPYPQDEFDLENPLWPPWRRTPWVATRHRMDALYGRDFSLCNMPQAVLDHIDDHFGPLSVETVSQAIHFARYRTITDRRGYNGFVSPERLIERLTFPILSLHGAQNGLADFRTLEHFKEVLTAAAPRFEQTFQKYPLRNHGHQDSLIGAGSVELFDRVLKFFDGVATPTSSASSALPGASASSRPPRAFNCTCEQPSRGVRVGEERDGKVTVSVAHHGGRGSLFAAVAMPVVPWDGRLCLIDAHGNRVEADVQALRALHASAPLTFLPSQGEASEPYAGRMLFSIDRALWRKGAHGVLLLLVYDQAGFLGTNSIGQDPQFSIMRLRRRLLLQNLRAPGLPRGLDGQVVLPPHGARADKLFAAIESVFKAHSADALALSVVRLPAGASPPVPLGRPASPGNADAAAGARVERVTFAVASCQYPAGMLDGVPAGAPVGTGAPADASYLRLAALLDGKDGAADRPGFLVLAGDQVYVDATAGLFDPTALDDRFSIPYERFFGSRGARSVLGRLPSYMLIDDHEIDDNWEPQRSGRAVAAIGPSATGARATGARDRHEVDHADLLERGRAAYLRMQRDVDGPARSDGAQAAGIWTRRVIQGLPFFLADTRTDRAPRRADTSEHARIMGPPQFKALLSWLGHHRRANRICFVASGAMLLPRLLSSRQPGASLRSDGWDGYPGSLHALLAFLFEHRMDNVVFLSGDAHLSCIARVELRRTGCKAAPVVVHSIHSSALYAPYPFANAIPEDFARHETFLFDDPADSSAKYTCSVETWFPPGGDGFGLVGVEERPDRWLVDVGFGRAAADAHGQPAGPDASGHAASSWVWHWPRIAIPKPQPQHDTCRSRRDPPVARPA